MPAYDLGRDEISQILADEWVVRVAFNDGESLYLIPLGYVWLRSSFCGVTEAGQKTRIADQNPLVAFQVDTSSATGLFDWRSVTGEGRFRIVANDEAQQEVLSGLQPVIAQAPSWWQREQAPRLASGELKVWNITPTRIHGRRFGPSEDTSR